MDAQGAMSSGSYLLPALVIRTRKGINKGRP